MPMRSSEKINATQLSAADADALGNSLDGVVVLAHFLADGGGEKLTGVNIAVRPQIN